jgi:hypothetical protein
MRTKSFYLGGKVEELLMSNQFRVVHPPWFMASIYPPLEFLNLLPVDLFVELLCFTALRALGGPSARASQYQKSDQNR